MTKKNCRHVTSTSKISQIRKGLKQYDYLSCESCLKKQSTATTSANDKKKKRISSPSGDTSSSILSSLPCDGWEKNKQWDDLSFCITCGFLGCQRYNHLQQHFKNNAKHCVGFHLAHQFFWCFSCQHEIEEDDKKTQQAQQECLAVFEELASKQRRRSKSRIKVIVPPPSPLEQSGVITRSQSKQLERGMETKEEEVIVEAKEVVGDQEDQEEAEAEVSYGLPIVGFKNLGNTCYFNASLQAVLSAIASTKIFSDDTELLSSLLEKYSMGNAPITSTFVALHESLRRSSASKKPPQYLAPSPEAKNKKGKKKKEEGENGKPWKILTPMPLLKELRRKFTQFRGCFQQDAHELFVSFLWAIDEELQPHKEKETIEEEEKEKKSEDEEEKHQIFVNTPDGAIVALNVKKTTSITEIQNLLAEKLQIDPKLMMLQHNGQILNDSVSAAPSKRVVSASQSNEIPDPLNFARNLFGGGLLTTVTCSHCGNVSRTSEDTFQLSLPIPRFASPSAGVSTTVQECLEAFTHESHLQVEKGNGYECDKCSKVMISEDRSEHPTSSEEGTMDDVEDEENSKKEPVQSCGESNLVLRDAIMTMAIARAPRILVIHLKRLCRGRKISQHIPFDTEMDIASVLQSPDSNLTRSASESSTKYELISVVVHSGTKRSGHYIAYVSREEERKATEDQEKGEVEAESCESSSHRKWYFVSDSAVKRVDLSDVLRCEAYMLFYQRK